MEFDYNDRADFSDRPSTAIVQNTSHNIFKKSIDNNNHHHHNHNNIVKSDWLSTALISALIGQFKRTVRVMPK